MQLDKVIAKKGAIFLAPRCTDSHEASRGLFATAELLVFFDM